MPDKLTRRGCSKSVVSRDGYKQRNNLVRQVKGCAIKETAKTHGNLLAPIELNLLHLARASVPRV